MDHPLTDPLRTDPLRTDPLHSPLMLYITVLIMQGHTTRGVDTESTLALTVHLSIGKKAINHRILHHLINIMLYTTKHITLHLTIGHSMGLRGPLREIVLHAQLFHLLLTVITKDTLAKSILLQIPRPDLYEHLLRSARFLLVDKLLMMKFV